MTLFEKILSSVRTTFLDVKRKYRPTLSPVTILLAISLCTGRPYAADTPAPIPDVLAPLHKIDLSKEVVLRYLIVTNKRLPTLRADEIAKAFLTMKAEAKKIIGADLAFEPVGEMAIDEFLKKYLNQDLYRLDMARYYVEIANQSEAIEKLAKNMSFSMRNIPIEELRAKIMKRIPIEEPKKLTRDELLKLAAKFQVESLGKLYSSILKDGAQLLDTKDFLQYTAWNLVGRAQDTFDIVVTNQAIGSAEIPTDLAIALRGGLNTGVTISSNNRIRGVVIMSYYPMVGSDAFIRATRPTGYNNPSEIFAIYMVHELGHLLKRFGHPVDTDPGCYMTPIEGLDYLGWIDNIRKTGGVCKTEPPTVSTYD